MTASDSFYKFVPFCSSMVSFFAGIQIFRFCPKTVDYSQVFYAVLIIPYHSLLLRLSDGLTDCRSLCLTKIVIVSDQLYTQVPSVVNVTLGRMYAE